MLWRQVLQRRIKITTGVLTNEAKISLMVRNDITLKVRISLVIEKVK